MESKRNGTSAPSRKYLGIRAPLHPLQLRSASSPYSPGTPSLARLAGAAHRRSRCFKLFARRYTRLRDRSGFTLIEIMVVIVILGLLAALVVPKLIGRTEEAKKTQARVQIKNIEQALGLFKLDNGFYPTTEQGIEALIKIPDAGRIPKNYRKDGYLDRLPKDPWGNPYVYVSPGEHGDYDISSYGADDAQGGEGEDGDINSWDAQ